MEGGIFDISKTEPKIVSEFRDKFGKEPIERMMVCRVPLHSALERLGNLITFGKYNVTKREKKYDHYYHLYLLFKFRNGQTWNIEKNERVKISDRIQKNGAKCMEVPFNPESKNLNEIIRNAEDSVGQVRLWYYNPLGSDGGEGGNCQTFIYDLLKSSGLMNESLKEFILQDVVAAIQKDSFAHKIMHTATNLKNRLSTFFQGGSLHEDILNEVKHVMGKGKAEITEPIRREHRNTHDIDILLSHPKLKTLKNVKDSNALKKICQEINAKVLKCDSQAATIVKHGKRIYLYLAPLNERLFYKIFLNLGKANIYLRKKAKEKGYKLNRHGLFKEGKKILVRNKKHLLFLIGSSNSLHTEIQAVIINKKYGTLQKANRWIRNNGYHPMKSVHITKNYYRYRMQEPNYEEYRYKTKTLNDNIKLIIQIPL